MKRYTSAPPIAMSGSLHVPRSNGSVLWRERLVSENALLLLLIALLACAAFLTPFVFRAADDNRLTSWRWVFADVRVAGFAALLAFGIVLAYALRRVALPPRRAGIWLFVASFVIGTAFWSEPEVIVDTARYFAQAKYLALYGAGAFIEAWGRELPAWTDLPLVPFLYGLIFRVAGEERIYIQAFTTLLFSATVVLTYRIGRELWDETLGCYGAALLLAMPYLLTQVPLMLVDVPAMFCVTLATFAAIKAFKVGGMGWIAAAAAALTLALLSKYSAWLMLTVLIPVGVVFARDTPHAALRRAIAIVGLTATALFGVSLLAAHDVVSAQLQLLWNYQKPGLGRWHESFVSIFLFQIHPFVTAAAAYSLYAAIRRRDLKYAVIGWMLALALLGQIGRIRYLLVLLPMLALMAAYGLREIRNSEARAFAAWCAVTSSLVVALFAYLPFLQTASAANLQRAGAYLDTLDAPRVEVIALEQTRAGIHPAVSVPLLDLVTHKPLAYRPDLVPLSPPAGIAISPLRFTWEYPLPQYYLAASNSEPRTAVAVILDGRSGVLPERVAQHLAQHCLSAEFMTSEQVFGYQTLVRVYQPAAGLKPRCPQGGIE